MSFKGDLIKPSYNQSTILPIKVKVTRDSCKLLLILTW